MPLFSLAARIRTLQPKVWLSRLAAAVVAALRRLLPLLALRQLLLPLIHLLLLLLAPLLRPVVDAVVVAVALLLLLQQTPPQLHPHPARRLRLLRRLLPADAVDNSAILTTIRRLDAVPRAWVACPHSTMQPVRVTLKRFAHCSMAAQTSTRPRLTVRLRWQSLFSTPSGTLRWN